MSLTGTVWAPIGPSPIAQGGSPVNGLVSAIAVNPANANIIYMGTAGGGAWRSDDGGATWFPLFDRQLSLAVGEPDRDCHVCQLAQAVGQAWHQEPVSLFDRSTVSPSRPGFRGAPRAAAVKTGPTKGRATARGGLVLTAASTAPNLARLGAEVDHAACRSASFLCSARCCMFK